MTAARTTHRIGIRVPDCELAAEHVAGILGDGAVRRPVARHGGAALRAVAHADPTVQLELIDCESAEDAPAPRVVDIGTHHLCWRVTDVDAAAEYVADLPGVTVLGDVIEIPDGPIAGNRWIYYRSPWGTLFELQQWPSNPPYTATSTVRLDHTIHNVEGARMPGYAGVDHSGYSVVDLEASIEHLRNRCDARVALRTGIAADREFMQAQFGIDVEGVSRMAMLTTGGLTLELFEHGVVGRQSARPATAFGGHHLALRGEPGADVARLVVDPVSVGGVTGR